MSDVAVIGAINDPLVCSLCVPRLSSIDVPCRAIGFEAARMLQQLMSGKRPQAPLLLPPGEIVVRQSSDTLSVADTDIASAVRFIREHAAWAHRDGGFFARRAAHLRPQGG